MEDDEKPPQNNDTEWDRCKRCGNETNTVSHFETCERDNEMLKKARKWIEYMDVQDQAIDTYITLCDKG